VDSSSDSINQKTGEDLHLPETSSQAEYLVSQFVHWIRNPLSSVSLYTELLEEEIADQKIEASEITSLLGSIQTEIDRLNVTVSEFYQYVRAPELEFEIMDINDLCSDLAGLHEEQFAAVNCPIRKVFSSEPLPALIDSAQLNQAVLNLLENALDSMNSGGEITLSTSRHADRIEVSVSDCGPGIPEGEKDKIFHPFFTTKEARTGLGLACCRKIAQAHNGSVRFENGPDGGAVFTLILPLHGRAG